MKKLLTRHQYLKLYPKEYLVKIDARTKEGKKSIPVAYDWYRSAGYTRKIYYCVKNGGSIKSCNITKLIKELENNE